MKKNLFLILLFVGTAPLLHAQLWEIGAGVGGCNYKGDVMPKFKPFVVGPGANAFVRMNYSRSVSLKVQGLIGQIHGNDDVMHDPFHDIRGFNFKANIMEASGQIEYNFMNFRTNASRIVNNWTPYVFAGGGYTMRTTEYHIKSIISTGTGVVTNGVISGSSNTQVNTWVLGIGFKKELSPHWNWGVEFGSRWINDDFLDGLGHYNNGTYNSGTLPASIDPLVLLNLKRQLPGTRAKDMYYYTNFSISYLFYKVHCPPTRR
ncbi:type IX secretion system protein PorG [Emticicia sp. 17c]|uniref:type IX secretion system protein PorG n=1 Tax=Emticicia sp. 17c TaxID=3127704 RepID=UPI00301C6A72